MRGWTLIFFTRIYILAIFIFVFTYEIQCFSFIFFLFIYSFIYLFRAANFMHNINIIHWSFFPTALPHRLPFLFLAFLCPCLFPCPAYILDLPMPTSFCLCLIPLPISSAFCLFPCPAYSCALPVSLPCLFPWPAYCPAYFLDLSMPTSFSYAYFLCLFPCPTYFCALPISFPCLFPCPAYFLALPIDLLFYECTLHGYIASYYYYYIEGGR